MSTELEALVTDGYDSQQIADYYGIGRRAAQRRLAAAGLSARTASTARSTTVATLTLQGRSAPEIAAQLGICVRQVSRLRAAAGVAKPQTQRWTPEQLAAFEHALTTDGWSYGEVARTYGIDKITLAQRFPGRGWAPGGGVTYRRLIERLDRVDAEYWANRYARAAGHDKSTPAAA